MAVTLTSPVLGQDVGYVYTGNLEAWLLSEGYAEQDGYTGPGVANSGPASVDPDEDPRLPENREAPYFPSTEDRNTTIANDGVNLTKATFPAPGFDMDVAGTDTEAPSDLSLDPEELPLAGGAVLATGNNLEGVTSVTVGAAATPATDLDVSAAGDGVVTFTAPALAAGAHDVVFVDASGNATVVGGLTYAA